MKKGQVTLFVILGIILVGAISAFFFFYKPDINLFRSSTSDPASFLTSCIEDSIKLSEKEFFDSDTMTLNTTLLYNHNRQIMPFLCYSSEFYQPCIPQNPLFIESIRRNMENKASRELSRCILTLKEDFEKRGYNFQYSSFNLELIFNEHDISYDFDTEISISKGEEVVLISNRDGLYYSVLPKLVRTAQTIVNYETTFCEFNPMTWQAFNRDVAIQRFRAGDQTKVYFLKSGDHEIKFAIRTCVMPAGI